MNVITKDRYGQDQTHEDVETVSLLDANGNEVDFYEGSKFDDYYKKSETYSQGQVDSAIGKAVLSSQSDWACDDAGNSQYVRNRTHFDSRQAAVSAVVDLEDESTVTFQGYKLRKISDKILSSTTEWSTFDSNNLETVKPMYSDTTVTLETTGGTTYNLNWHVLSVFLNALGTMPSGHVFQAWAYVNPYELDDSGNANQDYLNQNENFDVIFCFVREGNVLTKNEDGTAATLDTGTYIGWNAGQATDVAGATATITYGRLQKLDGKYLDLSGLYTKAEVDAIVKKAIQSVLPAFTADDEGKVLGIKDGKLAWIEVATASKDITVEGSSVYIYDVDTVVHEGNSLYLSDAVVEEDATVYLRSEAFDTVEQTGNALYLA